MMRSGMATMARAVLYSGFFSKRVELESEEASSGLRVSVEEMGESFGIEEKVCWL